MQAPNVAAAAAATPANEIAATVDADNHIMKDDEGIDADGEESSQADTESIRTTSTASLSESITEYRRIHGRTFSQKTDYWGPNDEKQNEALDIAHYWEIVFFDDKLFLAPIGDSPQKVLDLGTGTGIWAIDFADKFPSAQVTGVDISPIQPGWVPPNCKFQVDDIEQPWTWSADFDFIHIRHLEASIADWPALYKQAFDHLVPGGYVEVKEFDITTRSQLYGDDIPKDHVFSRWAPVFFEAADKLGKTLTQTHNRGIARALEAVGYVDIVEKRYSIPIGAWPKDPKMKEVGECNLLYNDQSLEGFALFLLKEIMGWEYAEIIVFVAEMRKALRDPKLQAYFHLHVVYARKPEKQKEAQAET
ncbi:UMTA protein [Colletotrichum scovillei]|uniref:UMTA protein n=1 Tax=Colletotrichum scovillei TaxID=1209932 RepID=UPI0015C3175A|nr:UMTA protein [Colletotrichum scovillei]KAF4783914.1 UMTA protein [Colletotrichum scovillei]